MAETLYLILRSGDILTIDGVTALSLDSSKTLKPGDVYQNNWVVQTDGGFGTPPPLTNEAGDVTNTGQAQRDESWLKTFWKFTRGTDLPILYHDWTEVEAICNLYPDQASDEADFYLPLKSDHVAVYSGVKPIATAITIDSDQLIELGDYWRKDYVEQITAPGVIVQEILTNQKGDAPSGVALRSLVVQASHYSIDRDALLTLMVPFVNIRSGPCSVYPNTPP